jgi:hypothetical protein
LSDLSKANTRKALAKSAGMSEGQLAKIEALEDASKEASKNFVGVLPYYFV